MDEQKFLEKIYKLFGQKLDRSKESDLKELYSDIQKKSYDEGWSEGVEWQKYRE